MKHALPALTLQFFEPEPHVRAPTLIAIVKCAVSRATPDLLRDGIEQSPRLAFRPLAVLNIDRYAVPFNSVSPLVAQRRRANQEPAIFTVSPLQPHFILGRFPGSHIHEPLFHYTWKVFGMKC